MHPPSIILRHRKENLKKCSLTGLEKRDDFLFISYPYDSLPPLNNYILLTQDAPPLTKEDSHFGLFLVDATWRYAEVMVRKLPQMQARSLPSFKTAYPRKQTDCPDPETGLASIEALYAAFMITGRNRDGLLDNYYWKDKFLEFNNPK
ncbi:MAG TPA: DUF367 domain-containing protein [Chlamydiales bacterium]|nr:DUF367 domain-containing protein [Chlamydiales bacterium]